MVINLWQAEIVLFFSREFFEDANKSNNFGKFPIFFLTYFIPHTFEMISPIRHFCMSVVVVGPLILIKILQLSEIWKLCSADGQFQLLHQMFKRIKIHTHRGTLEFLFLAVLGCFGYHPVEDLWPATETKPSDTMEHLSLQNASCSKANPDHNRASSVYDSRQAALLGMLQFCY